MAAHGFKRVLLGFQPGSLGRTINFAVELANLLDLELLGFFLDDRNLRDLASTPFARELRPLGGGWHPLDLERMSRDLEIAARATERIFITTAARLAARYQFEVIHAPMAEAVACVSRTGDIVMIVEPLSPAERATQQFAWLIEAAFRSAAAVMFVPMSIVRTSGPIVAIAAAPDDPSVQAAAGIAIAAKEALIIVHAYDEGAADDSSIRKQSPDPALTIEHIAGSKSLLSGPAAFSRAFHELRERLLVMTRDVFEPEAASMIAWMRHVPVLIIERPLETIDHTILPRQEMPRDSGTEK